MNEITQLSQIKKLHSKANLIEHLERTIEEIKNDKIIAVGLCYLKENGCAGSIIEFTSNEFDLIKMLGAISRLEYHCNELFEKD